MTARLLLVLLLFGLFGDTGREAGRRGNAFYEQGAYMNAAEAYRSGLAELEATGGVTAAALHNNLGATLHQQEKYEEARAAFGRAAEAADTDETRARAHYNAGTAAAVMGDIEAGLRHYRRTLLLDPTHEAARHNYEVLKRRQARSGAQPPSPPEVEPSPYARRLKKQAEALVQRQQYDAAATLMQEGLEQDSTVRAYRKFMGRLRDVARIDTLAP